jgi:outer membrane immunogenic protein
LKWIDVVMRGIASVVIILASTAAFPAFAADYFAVKAPAEAPVRFAWTGCYVGANLGGVSSADRNTSLSGNLIGFSSSGFVGGGQVGCDYAFAPGWVAGVEGRAAWSALKNSHPSSVTSLVTGVTVPSQFTLGNDFLASTTARLGYSFAERWLVFVRGGAAWTREKADDAFMFPGGIAVDPRASVFRSGWTVGTGVDFAFDPHWSMTLEYNYHDFGGNGLRLTSPNGAFVNLLNLKDTIHAATVGVNYRF